MAISDSGTGITIDDLRGFDFEHVLSRLDDRSDD